MTIEEQLDLPPVAAVLPLPEPIRETFPTEWHSHQTPEGILFGLSEAQHQSLILWLTDAARYISEVGEQLNYYRDGLQGEGDD